jgi:hypothetical protein
VLASRPAAVLALAVALSGCAGAGSTAVERPPGMAEDVVFTRDSPLATGAEIARRTLTPLTYLQAQRTLVDPGSMDRALDALERPPAVDPAERSRCQERLDRALATRLAEVEEAMARGDRGAALSRIKAVDAEFGGLAGPAVIELERRRAAPP